jgi:hypothetical protein
MELRTPIMTIVPAAGLTPLQPPIQSKRLSSARSSEESPARRESRGLPKSGDSSHNSTANWLVTEDEYFPFDADSFEER